MSVILQKDKVTGETLVYETTNYRDKKTGKSGTKKELLGWLAASSQADNYKTAVRLFDEAPSLMEDINALTENSFAATKAVGEMLNRKEGDDFSREEIIALFGKFSEVLDDKDAIFDKLSSFAKDLIEKAAYVVRKNETLQVLLDAEPVDEVNAKSEHEQLKATREQIKTYEEMVDLYKKIVANDEKIQANYEDVIAGYDEMKARHEKVIASGNKVIAIDEKRMANYDKIVFLQSKIMLDLIDRLSKHEDVSDLKLAKETSEAFLVKLYSPDIIEEMNAVNAYAAEGDAYEAAEEAAAEAAAEAKETD